MKASRVTGRAPFSMSDPTTPGVHTLAPTPSLLERLQPSIDREIAALPAGANGAFLAVANPAGGNLAVVARSTDNRLAVVGWVAKRWDAPALDYGVSTKVTW
jgi:hypothetical protein